MKEQGSAPRHRSACRAAEVAILLTAGLHDPAAAQSGELTIDDLIYSLPER